MHKIFNETAKAEKSAKFELLILEENEVLKAEDIGKIELEYY